jgi:hypothetical protein
VGNNGFKDLAVWQQAKDLAVLTYRVSDSEMKDERGTDKESIRYFFIAKGSVAELRTQLQIAHESGHLNKTIYETLETDYAILGKRIGKLIQARRTPSRP